MVKKVLFVPFNATSVSTMKPIFQELKKHQNAKPYILVSNENIIGPIAKNFISDDIIDILEKSKNTNNISKNIKIGFNEYLKSIISKIRIKKHITPVLAILRRQKLKKYLLANVSIVKSLFEKIKPDVIIISGDRHISVELSITKVAEKEKIKTLILPSIFPPDLSFLESYRTDSSYRVNHKFYVKYPDHSWLNKAGEYISFFNKNDFKVLNSLGFLPNNPKCNGASSNSIVLVESKRASRKIIEQGIDQNRVIITGNYSDDKIFKLKLQKKSLVAKMKNNHINDNYVLLAAPQLWEHGNVTRDESISIYLNIINELKKLDISVVVSLHPKMDFNFYNDIFKKNAENFVISNYDLHELIICAKCVVCWNISTVSLISLKANIPFIISDFQTGTQSILDDFESRFYSKTKDLSNSINNIISKNVFNNFYKNNKNDYMFGDGKCVNRILDNILE